MTVYGRRRRRALIGGVFALLLVVAGAAAARDLLGAPGRLPNGHGQSLSPPKGLTDGLAVAWPQHGQAALVVGAGRPAASPDQESVPIASLAKVMTAYLTLERFPLSGTRSGFTITVTAAEAEAEADDAAQGQSDVAVAAGEQLTERQLLEALLIPSGNNIADVVATVVAGSELRFVAEMNAQARVLGMDHTIYTDPSGFDPGTVSTAADQLRVFQRGMRFAVFREIVSTASVTLPVAGTLTNFDPLIADGYAGKTGSDSAAGGCLAFFTDVTVGGRPRTVVGVVLGQGEGNDTLALLGAAGDAAEQLVASVAPTAHLYARPALDTPGVRRREGWTHRHGLPVAPGSTPGQP
jgi:serine-type D-Ala-D-Ala carboxypeptidase (penicillin-binding protein 5/6)